MAGAERRILVTGARAPAALHLARLLDAAGHHVVMADNLGRTVSAVSRACRAFVQLPAANGDPDAYSAALHQAIAAHQIDLVIPSCEEVIHLAVLWARQDMPVPLYAPAAPLLQDMHHKFSFAITLQRLGLPVPETVLLQSADDVASVRKTARDLVFKPVWSRFATNVLIRPRRLTIMPTEAVPWVAQEYVSGDEISVYAFAHAGRVAGLAAYQSTYRASKGAGIAFVPVDDPAVAAFVARFVQATGWTGQVSFDLMRRADGTVVALECNPRSTSGVHLFRDPARFAPAFLGQGAVAPDVTGLQAVKAAMWLYGPMQRPLAVWRDLWRAQDVMAWPGDPAPARRQTASLCEVAGIAMRERVSLNDAATFGITWDG
ncbi:ATP-grasp domain-containing protein [Loktanella agnita]|uniref:ATP-grasp domain-containing protein n=1 Tax=Loktanella agnita TaxID=287097 RepID=UPI00398A40B0